MNRVFSIVLTALLVSSSGADPNFVQNVSRPLRYRPDGGDFVIENGTEYFNRPLYIRNTAMRVDAGDRPQFSLFLPGRGGDIRLGVRVGREGKWLDEMGKIVARYRPGEMVYEVSDSLFDGVNLVASDRPKKGQVDVRLLTLADVDGVVVRVEGRDLPNGAEVVFAMGGMNGDKGRRNGDIGCESVPVSEFFRFKPEYARGNAIKVEANRFELTGKPGILVAVCPDGMELRSGDAMKWNKLAELVDSTSGNADAPVAVGVTKIGSKPLDFVIVKPPVGWALPTSRATEVGGAHPTEFDEAEARIKNIRERVVVDTPDPFINAAVAALNVAADGVWDEKQGAVMHGAVAWRVKLLGWRGPYANDELGWHDRAERHFRYWAGQQNTSPIPATQPGPDESANLSRSEAALHSNGDISHSHYDMNLVYIDALFRHLMWTGDLKMGRELWPVIVRHLAWERRLFRREFGEEKLPLYEGYCDFWASDDVFYSGGAATHASAYNYWHNRMAAKIARAIGEDPAPYDREADLIWKAMQKLLWVEKTGCFGEYKDLLGEQLVHPAAAVWTVYHTIDSQACTPEQALWMTRYIDREIARIPIKGPGVPDENLYTIPTTNWLPYTWSTNNVVMAESAHTSLAYWQAGRPDDAFRLFKGCVLDSMYMGLCPGNAGMCTQFDVARGESQRDFADAVGTCSRAVVEGLFGVRPNLVEGEVVISPGFPSSWDHASIRHPDFTMTYQRDGNRATYSFEARFARPVKVRFRFPGQPDRLFNAQDRVEFTATLPEQAGSAGVWPVPVATDAKHGQDARATKFETVDLTSVFNDRVTNLFKHDYLAPRSPFCSLSIPKQGIGSWCHPETKFEVSDSGLRRVADQGMGESAASDRAERVSGIRLPNGIPLRTQGTGDEKNIAFVSRFSNFPKSIEVPLSGQSDLVTLMFAGSTNSMQSRFDNGMIVVTYTDGTTGTLALNNPVNWWPIDQDYLIDDYAFKRPEPLPIRIDLETGAIRVLEMKTFKGRGGKIRGGAATVLTMPLNPSKTLKSLVVQAKANEVVIGLMAVTLSRK